MTVWITKTKSLFRHGITCHEVTLHEDGSVSWATNIPGWRLKAKGEGVEWHRTREGAVERAEAIRQVRVAKLKRELARIKAAF